MEERMDPDEIVAGSPVTPDSIRAHYDRLSVFYRDLWGEHIHHGYFDDGQTPAQAQARLVERLAGFAGIRRGSRVLDIGCGLGGSAIWLARHLDCTVTGITISGEQARLAREQVERREVDDRVTVRVQDANHLDGRAEIFDAAWIIECSEHLDDKADFFRRCARALRPGGVLALAAWLNEAPEGDDQARALVERVRRGMLCPSLVSGSQYERYLADAGFECVRHRDITTHVRPTWAQCLSIVHQPPIAALVRLSEPPVRRGFVDAFEAIDAAYARGVMAYGLFTAQKAGGAAP